MPERDETIETALRRELDEELGVQLQSNRLLGAMLHHYYSDILVLVHGCSVEGIESARVSEEHSEMAMFSLNMLPKEELPLNYVELIEIWNRE